MVAMYLSLGCVWIGRRVEGVDLKWFKKKVWKKWGCLDYVY